jgi:putative endonuclease
MRMNNIGAEPAYYVYILTNKSNTVLYVGVTSDIINRYIEHKEKKYPNSFTARYNICKLVWYQKFGDINDAIAREKQLKGGSRSKKILLIENLNPMWNDLFETKIAPDFL